MIERAEKLISEIQQIKTQYQTEVGSRRKPWPNSIKERVQQLFEMGYTGFSISKDSGIPYYSVLNWKPRAKKPKSSFHALTVPTLKNNQLLMVTVQTPKGFHFEGSADSIVVILKNVREL
jgi:hypothetical protein